MDCLFCKIIDKQIPAKIVYEDDFTLAFDDISPQAPIHFLVIPKLHLSSLNEMEDSNLAGKILLTAKKVAKEKGISSSGYRVVLNTNDDGGQTVFHLHAHVLGKRKMLWPPG